MKLLAISGWSKSGKDTAAKILIDNYGFKRIAFAEPLKNTVAEQFDFERLSLDNQALKEAPLLNMRVEPKDPFTRMIAEFMYKEFRTKFGKQADSFYYNHHGEDISDASFLGIVSGMPDESGEVGQWTEPLYWTRRALMILEGSSKRSTTPNYWVERAIKTAREQGMELVVISDLRYRNEIYALKSALSANDELTTIRVDRFDTSPSQDPSERDLDDAKFDIVLSNRGTVEEFDKKVRNLAEWILDPDTGRDT
jgi:hypothetical protein